MDDDADGLANRTRHEPAESLRCDFRVPTADVDGARSINRSGIKSTGTIREPARNETGIAGVVVQALRMEWDVLECQRDTGGVG